MKGFFIEVTKQSFNFMTLVGIAVLIGGLFLGVQTFWQAFNLFENPHPITKWIEICDAIFFTEKQPQAKSAIVPEEILPAEKKPAAIDKKITSTNQKNVVTQKGNPQPEIIRISRIFTRMFSVFISILLLWILAKISLSMIGSGTEIINKSKIKLESDSSEV